MMLVSVHKMAGIFTKRIWPPYAQPMACEVVLSGP